MPPGRFLSDAEIERLEGWPEVMARDEQRNEKCR